VLVDAIHNRVEFRVLQRSAGDAHGISEHLSGNARRILRCDARMERLDAKPRGQAQPSEIRHELPSVGCQGHRVTLLLRRESARNNFRALVSDKSMRRPVVRVVLRVVLPGLLSSALFAQPAADPSFEVASVKSNRTEAPATTLFPLGPGDAYAANGGRFRATNQPLIVYLRFAYRLGQGDLLDLPRWAYNDRFHIETPPTAHPT